MSTKTALCVLMFVIGCSACSDGNTVTSPSPAISQPPAAPTFTLSGVISRATASGVTALEGVQVQAGPQIVTTDENGYYSLSGLSATVSLMVRGFPYKIERRDLTLSGDTQLDMLLVRLPRHSLSGVVFELTPAGPMPVEGALITGSFDAPVTTDENGSFSIPGGVYESEDYLHTFSVMKEGYEGYFRTLPMTEDTRLEVLIIRR